MKKSNNYSLKLAIPFFYARNKFLINRKSRWTILDLFFLKIISIKPVSIEELVLYSNLKRQLIIQIILPFVKSGWVEIIQNDNSYIFSVTELGIDISKRESLPDFPEVYERTREYIIDPVSNRYYGILKNSNIKFESMSRIAELNKDGLKIKILNVSCKSIIPNYDEINKCVVYDDEYVNHIFLNNGKIEISEFKYILFDVKYNIKTKKMWFNEDYSSTFSLDLLGEIKGKFNFLFEQIILESNNVVDHNNFKNNDTADFILKSKEPLLNFHKMYKENIIYVYGGEQHKKYLLELINNAKTYLIIHSTFISKRAFYDKSTQTWTEVAIELKNALKRNITVTILFGKDKPDPDDLLDEVNDKNLNKTLSEISEVENLLEKFNQECIDENIFNIIQLNDHKKTGSHVKYIICDHIDYGPVVMTGSCNYFFSNFDRFEASVILMDANITHDFLMISSILCIAKDLHSNDLREYFLSLAEETMVDVKIATVSNGDYLNVAIVYKNQHYSLIDKAKVNASNKIMILSDKLSHVPMNPIFEAIKNNTNSQKTVYFSNKSQFYKHDDEMALRKILKSPNYKINLQLYSSKINPRSKSHAKVLTWDENDLVITSLNWLSASASVATSSDIYHEIGIYIQGNDIVKEFEVAFSESING